MRKQKAKQSMTQMIHKVLNLNKQKLALNGEIQIRVPTVSEFDLQEARQWQACMSNHTCMYYM